MALDIWLSSGQVAKALRCSINTVHDISRDDLHYELVGKKGNIRKYHLSDVEAYDDKRREEAEEKEKEKAEERAA